ncbi:MAG: hypothetical protein FWE23_07425 [Chitinivibrionia bacterium]|nr:hypothetical protein [Chitinivibrionia bacterium]
MQTTEQSAEQPKKPKKPRNKWTYIFVQVMEYLLRNHNVQIIPEFELYKAPMRIDIVIIKLLEKVVIKNTVMKFFRAYNIIEFKGPTDNLNIQAFDRVLSYFHSYISQNSLNINDIAITLVSIKKPENLLEILKIDRGYKISSAKASGIYYIKAVASPAMQLVVNSELSARDVDWIKAIRNDWTVEDGVELVKKFESTGEDKILREVLYSLCIANNDILEEVEKMTADERKTMKFLSDWSKKSGMAQKWKQEGVKQGEQRATQQIITFLSQGHSLEEAKKKFAFA